MSRMTVVNINKSKSVKRIINTLCCTVFNGGTYLR